jgi:hypothetical protein
MTTYSQRVREWISTGINVILFNGDSDEMLSSRAWREQWVRMIYWLDWAFGQGHCRESYEWEKQHYNVNRFE